MKNFNLNRIAPVFAMTAVMLFAWGFYSLLSYSLPLAQNDFPSAIHSKVADKPDVFYSAARDAYQQKKYELAKKLASLAFENLLDPKTKVVPANRASFAADVLFLHGKALQRLDKKEAAIEAYRQSLRLKPDNKPCKYNLEMLTMQQPPSGGGGGGSSKPDNGKPKPDNGKPQPDDGNKPSNGSGGKPKPKI